MPGNIDPIFTRVGDVTRDGTTGMAQPVTAAANDFTGAGANNVLVFTADSTNGGYLRSIRIKAAGTNVATVARFFLNNGSANTSASNNAMIGEIALPATTSSATAVTSSEIEYPVNIALPPGFRLYVGLGTAVSAGWFFVPLGGKY